MKLEAQTGVDGHLKCHHCQEDIILDEVLYETKEKRKLRFCCHGCLTVFKIINLNGLGHFYDLKVKGNEGSSGPVNLQDRDFAHLDGVEFRKQYLNDSSNKWSFNFFIEGVHCVACLWLLESLPVICKNVLKVKLNMSNSILEIEFEKESSLEAIAIAITNLGYIPRPILEEGDKARYALKEKRAFLLRIGISFACAGNIMLYTFAIYNGAGPFFEKYFNLFSFICSFPIVFYCATPFYKSAWSSIKNHDFSIDIPIVFVLILGFLLGGFSLISSYNFFYFDTLAILVFLLLSSRFILKYAQKAVLSGENISSFYLSSTARKVTWKNGIIDKEEMILSQYLEIYDEVSVWPGEVIPIDGVVTSATKSMVNNSLLSGESVPCVVNKDDLVYMGAKNLSSKITIKVLNKLNDSRFGKILQEVESGWKSESNISLLASSFAKRFVIGVFSLSILFFIYFYVTLGLEVAFVRTFSLLIITCPCALALTTPLALIMGLTEFAKNGVIVKSEQVVERMANIEHVFFDKTGTLTHGEFEIIDFQILEMENFTENKLLRILYTLEQFSEHPIANAIVSYIDKKYSVEPLDMDSIVEHAGRGVNGVAFGQEFRVERSLSVMTGEAREGVTKVGLFKGNTELLIIGLIDKPRENIKEVIKTLHSLKIEPHILSGDQAGPVKLIQKFLGINNDNSHHDISPENKRNIINLYRNAMMIGDGVNDAMALKSASVGVAVRGSVEVSLRASDIYLSSKSVDSITGLILASKYLIKIIYRNMAFSLIYNIVGVVLAFTGNVSPLLAAILMPLSSLTVLASTVYSNKKLKKILKNN